MFLISYVCMFLCENYKTHTHTHTLELFAQSDLLLLRIGWPSLSLMATMQQGSISKLQRALVVDLEKFTYFFALEKLQHGRMFGVFLLSRLRRRPGC